MPSSWSAAAAHGMLCMQPRAGLSYVLQGITAAGCAGSSQHVQGTALLAAPVPQHAANDVPALCRLICSSSWLC